MREQELAFKQKILEAQDQLDKCQRGLEAAMDTLRTAMKEEEKIQIHKKNWLTEAMAQEERAQEQELEEFKPRSDMEHQDHEYNQDW